MTAWPTICSTARPKFRIAELAMQRDQPNRSVRVSANSFLSVLARALKPFSDEFLRNAGRTIGVGLGVLIIDMLARISGIEGGLLNLIGLMR
jgi:hypothetical protein